MSRLPRVSRWLFVLVLGCAATVAAQQPGASATLRGRVLDAPGDVDLVISAPGFATRRVQRIHLEVGQSAEVEIDLHLSAVEERVTVAGDAGTVNVLSSVVGAVVSAREIESLPLNGRNFLELALFRVPAYPWTPALFVLLVACVLAVLAVNRPLQAFGGLAIVALGWPAYDLFAARRKGGAAGAVAR